jgi:hypothetical protein
MLKGYDKILELCDNFIIDNFFDDFENVEISTDFECYPDTKEIFIGFVAPKNAVDGFIENLYTRTKINDISDFTWSFLHEVGHCMTWNYLNKRTQHHCEYVKRKIERGSIDYLTYYTLADEKIATDWAGEYLTDHFSEMVEFDRELLEILGDIWASIPD